MENKETIKQKEVTKEVTKEVAPKELPKENFISKTKLLDSGIQYGHITRRWNPAMKPFIHSANKNVHIIDLNKTVRAMQIAFKAVSMITEKEGKFLFVGTLKQAKKTIEENAKRSESFYISERWLGGLLTNWKTIQNLINKMIQLEKMEAQSFAGYSKKEALLMKKDLIKLQKVLEGIRNMRRLPSAIFVTSVENDLIAIKEAKKLGIPVFGISDTNVDPNLLQFPIPGNDDSNKSIALITTIIADAICFAKGMKTALAFKKENDGEIIGIDEQYQNIKKDAPVRKVRKPMGQFGKKPFVKREAKTYVKRENNIEKEVKEELVTHDKTKVTIEDKNEETEVRTSSESTGE